MAIKGQVGQVGHAGGFGRLIERCALGLLIAVAGQATLYAQVPALPAAAVMAAASESDTSAVRLLVGRSTVLDVGTTIARVSLTSAEIADALVTSPHQLLINGKMPGTISMFVWDRGGSLRRYEVVVQRDLARLAEQVKNLFPGEAIEVQSNGKNVVLSGFVSKKDVIDKAVSVAAGYVDKKEEVTTLLQVQQGAASNQVLLRVRFAEVSRSALTELGASFFTSPTGVKNTIARTSTQQYPAPGFTDLSYTKRDGAFGSPVVSADGKFTFSDFLNFFLFNEKYDLGMMVKALQTKGLFQSLAEPNLVAESGKEASFLAGGEIPIPVAQGTGSNVAITIMYKEFGIRLNFTPTVNGNRVHLKVRPEVSTLDFNNAIVLQGFRIPALNTRRTETELELQDGQTFAIAGLMNNSVTSTLQKIPGIGDIPILGLLFQSKAAQKEQTELVVMITPHILANASSGVTPSLPKTPEPFMAPLPDKKTIEPPPPAFPPPAAPVGVPARPGQAPASTGLVATQAPAVTRPLTPEEQKTAAGDQKTKPAATKRQAGQASAEQRKMAKTNTQQNKLTHAQAKRDAEAEKRRLEAAREQGERDAEAAKRAQEAAREQARRDAEAAKRSQEDAQRQAEIDSRQQKEVDRALAKLRAAEAEYNSELAKKNKRS